MIEDVENGRLRSHSFLSELASLDTSLECLDKAHFWNPSKSKLAPMVLHATVEKLTTWKTLLMPLLTEGRVIEGSANKRSKLYNSTVLRQQIKDDLRTQSRLTWTTISHIPRNQSLHSQAQARCFKQLCLDTRQTHILHSPWVLNIALLMVYRRTSRIQLICRMCLPLHICTIQVPHRCHLSRSNQSHSIITQDTHQLPIAVMKDAEPNKGIIRTILSRPHHRMCMLLISGQRILGILHSPCQSGILHRRRIPPPAAQYKHRGNGEISGGQGERGETP
jgi:hypothetical protein